MRQQVYVVELTNTQDTIQLTYDNDLQRAQNGYNDWLQLKTDGLYNGNVTLVVGMANVKGDIKQKRILLPETAVTDEKVTTKFISRLNPILGAKLSSLLKLVS